VMERGGRWTDLVGETHEAAEELGEMHLTGAEFTTAGVVGAVEGGDRVDDNEGEPVQGAIPSSISFSTHRSDERKTKRERTVKTHLDSLIIAPANTNK
jgi:hypothetical protein